MNKVRYLILGFVLFFGTVNLSYGTTITYTATDLLLPGITSGSERWQYDYTVFNDTLGFPIGEFTVYFDYSLYDNLVADATPSGWDPLTLNPVPSLLIPGVYDALALSSGISAGSSLGGFVVSFDWLGAPPATPGSQYFEVVDPRTFSTLDSGQTSAGVPEPCTLVFLVLGIGVAGAMQGVKKRK